MSCALRVAGCVWMGSALIVAFGLAMMGCDQRDALGVRRVAPESVEGDAIVRGKVRFLATPPVMKALTNKPCHDGAPPTIMGETVLVGADGGLKNVLVYIEGGPMVDGRSLPPVVLDQVNCQYTPHVVGVVVGQPLKVKSSDPTYHNTHYSPAKNPSDNFGLLRAGHERDVRFVAAEIFPVRCDVHPWMRAYIGVFDNPFFAATGEDGAFEIRGLSAGEYTLVAWHEMYGSLRRRISITAAAAVEVDFEYKPPGPN